MVKDGTELTGKHLTDLLPGILGRITERVQERPDLVLAGWREAVGEKLFPMAKAVSFEAGILTVKVKNSTVLSLLVQHEKQRLLKQLQEKFPNAGVRNIVFRQ